MTCEECNAARKETMSNLRKRLAVVIPFDIKEEEILRKRRGKNVQLTYFLEYAMKNGLAIRIKGNNISPDRYDINFVDISVEFDEIPHTIEILNGVSIYPSPFEAIALVRFLMKKYEYLNVLDYYGERFYRQYQRLHASGAELESEE